jgi:hypothetical protein
MLKEIKKPYQEVGRLFMFSKMRKIKRMRVIHGRKV